VVHGLWLMAHAMSLLPVNKTSDMTGVTAFVGLM